MYIKQLLSTCLLLSTLYFNAFAQLAPACSDPPFIVENSYESVELFACDGPANIRDVVIDGDWAAFSSTNFPDPGAVYMYYYNGAEWEAHSKLTVPGLVFANFFGNSLQLKNDKLLVGAPGSSTIPGKAYLFAFDGTSWVEKVTFEIPAGFSTSSFGRSVEIMETGAGFDLIYVGASNLVSVFKVDPSYNIIGSGNLPDNFEFGTRIIAEGEWLYILGKKCYLYRYNGSRYELFQSFASVSAGPSMIAMDFPSLFYNRSPFCGACRGSVSQIDFDGSSWVSAGFFVPRPEFAACGHTGGFGGTLNWDMRAGDNNLFIYADDRRFKVPSAGVIYWYQRASSTDNYELKASYTNPAVFSGYNRMGAGMDYDNGRLIISGSTGSESVAMIIDIDKICTPPANLSATAVVGGVNLSWDAVPGASNYKVRIKDCNGSSPSDDVLITTQTTSSTSLFIPLTAGPYEWDIETDCGVNTSERFANFSNFFNVPTLREMQSLNDSQALLDAELKVVPNPAHDFASVSSDQPLNSVWIADISGRNMEVGVNRISPLSYTVDVSNLPAGLYIVFGESEGEINRTTILVK